MRNEYSFLASDYVRPSWNYEFDVGASTDAQACLDAAYDTNTTFDGIRFDNVTGACSYYSDLWATSLRSPGEEPPQYWVRIDQHMQSSAMASCLTDQDAMYLLVQMVYKDRTCTRASS